MKRLILLFLFPLSLFADSQIQIHAIKGSDGVTIKYAVYSQDGPDQGMVVTNYSIEEAQAKFGKLLDSNESGTSKPPDRIFLNYDDSGNLKSVQYQVLSVTTVTLDKDGKTVKTDTTGSFETTAVKDVSQVSVQVKSDAEATKIDVTTKEASIDSTPLVDPLITPKQ